MTCTHDPRFHLMGAANGCCACEVERLTSIVDMQSRSLATVRTITVRVVPADSREPCEGALTIVLAGNWELIEAARAKGEK